LETIKTACPLDCCDQCALLATVDRDRGRLISIEPNPGQPVTGNTICSKGKKHLERINHPDRLRHPMMKNNGVFEKITWQEATQVMAAKIEETLEQYGPLALLHFYDGGYTGLKKNIESRFFSALGGSTTHYGSLCWGAGLAAQHYDFGAVKAHPYHDLVNSRLILIWGRNPAATSVHQLPFIQRARQSGAVVILIDPVETATARVADRHIRIRPGTDGALALAMANLIIENGRFDQDFVSRCSRGFSEFEELCREFTPQKAAELTGIDVRDIKKLTADYASSDPAAIIIGIGLQRHSNGGNTVRAIDALAALCGNVGVSGGGANYANFRISRFIDHHYMSGEDLKPQRRYYPKARLAEALHEFTDPPVSFLYNSRANPLVQVPDGEKLRQAFKKVPFKVTADFFMTDTAAASDLVLPATYFLEEADLYFNSMSHQYLTYGLRAINPQGECRSEYELFKELAGLLGLKEFPRVPVDDLLAKGIRPLTEATGITLEQLKGKGPFMLPGGDDIPWYNRIFETIDGKYQFYSEGARSESGDALPVYREPVELGSRPLQEEGFDCWFLTPHPHDSIHSTHRLPGANKTPQAYIHPQTAAKKGLVEGRPIRISSKRGRIEAKTLLSERMPADTVVVYEGWWQISGAAVNELTPDRLTDLGAQAAYYDCLCRVELL